MGIYKVYFIFVTKKHKSKNHEKPYFSSFIVYL
jgi:hypothetical protein